MYAVHRAQTKRQTRRQTRSAEREREDLDGIVAIYIAIEREIDMVARKDWCNDQRSQSMQCNERRQGGRQGGKQGVQNLSQRERNCCA